MIEVGSIIRINWIDSSSKVYCVMSMNSESFLICIDHDVYMPYGKISLNMLNEPSAFNKKLSFIEVLSK